MLMYVPEKKVIVEEELLPEVVLVEVTEEDIKSAKLRLDIMGETIRSLNCPVAIAGGRVFKSPVAVAPGTMYVVDSGKWLNLPRFVSKWIGSFDSRKPVEPLSFLLPINE